MDNLLMPEVKRLHEALRQEDMKLSYDEKRAKYLEFAEHVKELVRYSNLARKEGLLALEEVAEAKKEDAEVIFDRELILLIVDGTAPEHVERVILLKYFSTEQTVHIAIKNIMSIYAFLNIQVGVNPRVILQMLKNIIPAEVRDVVENFSFRNEENGDSKEINIDDYCVGGIRMREKDLGYFETRLCEQMLLALSDKDIQRVLRDIDPYTLCGAMKGFSGECRKHVFANLSGRVAQDLAENLRIDDPADENTYYRHLKWELNDIRDKNIKILSTIERLECQGEIIISPDSSVRFLSLILQNIYREDTAKKEKARECELLIRTINNYRRYELGD